MQRMDAVVESVQQNETYLQCVLKRAVGGECGCFKVSPHLCHFPSLTFTNLQSPHSYCRRDGLAAQSLQQTVFIVHVRKFKWCNLSNSYDILLFDYTV